MVKRYSTNQMSNVYKTQATEIYKTTSQLNFDINDRIAFTATPRNDADYSDFSHIKDIEEKPYLGGGNKHRTVTYKEYWLTLS